jgi:hypothetical protein
MTRHLLFYLLLAFTGGASVRAAEPSQENSAYLAKVGLVADEPASPAAVPEETKSCERVTFTRNQRYGESEQNILEVATGSAGSPVLLFVAGESFPVEKCGA